MNKDNGGPAYPIAVSAGATPGVDFDGTEIKPGTTVYHRGLTVRDYMAIHASDEDVEKILFSLVGAEIRPTRQQARYMHADAMLLERAK